MSLENRDAAKKWDAMANRFDSLKIPQWESDPFLKVLSSLPIWDKKPKVLDLGCGAGRFSVAVAKRCSNVLGSDISPKMIEFANEKKKKYGADNVSFEVLDWHEADIEEKGFDKVFDLIFGHMTPAIDSIEAVEKMNKACKGYCAMATFAKREARTRDELESFLGISNSWHKSEKAGEIFKYLFENGFMPQVNYYDRDDLSVYESEEGAFNYLKAEIFLDTNSYDESFEKKIRDFIKSKTKDGVFKNEVYSTIITILWKAGD